MSTFREYRTAHPTDPVKTAFDITEDLAAADSGGNDWAAPVADLAALRAVAPSDRQDRQQRFVEGVGEHGAVYAFNAEGTGTDDGDLIITPTTGTGRWFKGSSGGASAAWGDIAGDIETQEDLNTILNTKLYKASNLSDLDDVSVARDNLGLGTAAVADLDTDETLAADSDGAIPSQKAVKAYVDASAGGVLFSHYADVGNVTTGQTDLYSDPIPPAALASNGAVVQFRYGVKFVGSTSSKDVRAYFGGSALLDTGALAITVASAMVVEGQIVRESASVVRYDVSVNTAGVSTQVYAASGRITGLDLSTPQTLKITGQASGVGAATNDIVANEGAVWQPGSAPAGSGGDLLSVLTSAEVAVTGAVTLDATAFGKMHKCSGTSADYTVTLPAVSGNAGKFIGFRMLPALTKLVTLDGNGSEAIDGATMRVMWANETAILLCDGTAWTKIAGKTIPMSCWLYKATSQTDFPSTAFTLINLDTVSTDNTGRMADTGNNQIVVRRPSNYYFQGQVWIDANLSRIIAQIRKNGSAIAGYDGPQRIDVAAYNVASTFPDQFALAANDTIQLWGYQVSGGTQTITCGGAANTRLAVYEIPSW